MVFVRSLKANLILVLLFLGLFVAARYRYLTFKLPMDQIAHRLYTRGSFVNCQKALEKLQVMHPDKKEVDYNIAVCQYRLGRYLNAYKKFEKLAVGDTIDKARANSALSIFAHAMGVLEKDPNLSNTEIIQKSIDFFETAKIIFGHLIGVEHKKNEEITDQILSILRKRLKELKDQEQSKQNEGNNDKKKTNNGSGNGRQPQGKSGSGQQNQQSGDGGCQGSEKSGESSSQGSSSGSSSSQGGQQSQGSGQSGEDDSGESQSGNDRSQGNGSSQKGSRSQDSSGQSGGQKSDSVSDQSEQETEGSSGSSSQMGSQGRESSERERGSQSSMDKSSEDGRQTMDEGSSQDERGLQDGGSSSKTMDEKTMGENSSGKNGSRSKALEDKLDMGEETSSSGQLEEKGLGNSGENGESIPNGSGSGVQQQAPLQSTEIGQKPNEQRGSSEELGGQGSQGLQDRSLERGHAQPNREGSGKVFGEISKERQAEIQQAIAKAMEQEELEHRQELSLEQGQKAAFIDQIESEEKLSENQDSEKELKSAAVAPVVQQPRSMKERTRDNLLLSISSKDAKLSEDKIRYMVTNPDSRSNRW